MGEKTILVVESDRAILTLLTVAWSSEGHIVLPAAGGRGALSLADQRRPDVIVVDMAAPDGGGVDLCWRFRTAASTAAAPIVALVAGPNGRAPAALLPVKASVLMPFDLVELTHVVTRLADGLSLPYSARLEMREGLRLHR